MVQTYDVWKLTKCAKVKGKFYGTPTNMSVLVHQINKLIVKSDIFWREKLFSITYN